MTMTPTKQIPSECKHKRPLGHCKLGGYCVLCPVSPYKHCTDYEPKEKKDGSD